MPQAHTKHHRHLELAELVWPVCLEVTDMPYALTHSGIVGVGGIVQWRIVVKDGRIVEVMEVVGVEGSRVLFERFRPPHDTVLNSTIAYTQSQLCEFC